MALQYTTAARNAKLDALTTAIGNAGKLRIYSGTPPANADAGLAGNTLLAELTCGSPFAAAASSGVLTANAISNDTAADATGTATFFRIVTSGGTTVIQGTVGTSGADLIVSTTSFVQNVIVSVTSLTITEGGA